MDRDKLPERAGSACVKCGTCQTVCPVFSVRPEESSAARGKMALSEAVTQGFLDQSVLYREYLETCLLCGACEETCPNEVKTLATMLNARESLAADRKIKPGKRMILEKVIGDPRHLDLVMRTGRSFQDLVFKRIPDSSGIRRRIPLPLITRDRTLPSLAPVFFTEKFSGQVRTGHGPRVGIFAGCMTNYFYPGVGEAMIDLLGRLGANVIVPAGQVCCGMPALTGGATETVRELAVRNLEAFEDAEADAIITGCASCGGNLKDNYGRLLDEAGVEAGRITRFLQRIMDVNEFLIRQHAKADSGATRTEKDKGLAPLTVTYHHPCHLGRLQGVREEPIHLICSLSDVRYEPMAEDSRCCGMGGSFSLEHYDVAKAINDRKVARILETGADAVVTSCPACIMHIRDGLVRNGRPDVAVLHIAELLERHATQKKGREENGKKMDVPA